MGQLKLAWKSNYKLAVALVIFAIVVALVSNWVKGNMEPAKKLELSKGPRTIVLKEGGFSPAEITIQKGEIITFTTTLGKEFWPASDLHPTHTLYPEFDPKKPIAPDASWAFTFDKTGSWQYHDHLAPLYLGTINVIEGSKAQESAEAVTFEDPEKCHEEATDSSKTRCWEQDIEYVIQTQGITSAFNLYAQFYKDEPVFAENCHGFTHKIGEGAYKIYSQQKDFDVTSQVAYCSYGFFHGFIEAMFQDTGTLDKARDFCDYIDNKLKGQTSALGACMHGIGHGVTDGSDPTAWGSVEALIEPGKKLCEKVSRDDYEKSICGSGIFNSLEVMYQNPKYKITLDKKDPFWICKQQTTDYFSHACFTDFKDIIMVISNQDFAKAAKFVEEIKDDKYASAAIDNLATYAAYQILRKPSYNYAIDICHHLQPRLHVGCIAGLGAGFMTAGEPDKEYIKAVELCKSPLITKDERAGCFARVLHGSHLRYSPEIHKRVCDMVDPEDKNKTNFCNG